VEEVGEEGEGGEEPMAVPEWALRERPPLLPACWAWPTRAPGWDISKQAGKAVGAAALVLALAPPAASAASASAAAAARWLQRALVAAVALHLLALLLAAAGALAPSPAPGV
jgi:hypothetical protein